MPRRLLEEETRPFPLCRSRASCIADSRIVEEISAVNKWSYQSHLRGYVMSVAHDSIIGAHLRIRRAKYKVLNNFYWPELDGDMTRYCRSCDMC
ncbi:reverse transcriptase [Plakobranchus ocellatus]|uniref:Reverse transcriptase n=1 Tax=Plakobranchus ocellatus TaxID=259542 RepID=A0AAV3Z5M7_9GAST|nr:reverse transcriptase [Plakobranchus ocellatus]